MNAEVRAAVQRRANNCCEYCLRRQQDSPLIALHVEHVIPRKHNGGDEFENLALACAECNLHKGTNLTGIDPDSRQVTPVFNPRLQTWSDHFSWDGLRIEGKTAIGRTTIEVLRLNSPERIRVRLATSGSVE